MTDLTKSVKRVSRSLVREAGNVRQIVVILRPAGVIGFRAKGCRKEYQLPIEACYSLAVKAHVLDLKRQKAKAKKAKRANHK